jgi:predicted NBD/HSP70 family sugar kinase
MHTEPHAPLATAAVLDAASMRAQHRRLMLNLLWNEREASRADLARRTGLSRSTVSAIVSDLLETGLVVEARTGASTGGRRPIVLAFRGDAAFLVGVELGASHVLVALTDLFGAVLDSRERSCPVRDDPEAALAAIEACVAELLGDRVEDELVGVGVAAPSPVDPRRPGELVPSVVPRWAGIDLIERLEGFFGRPVFVDNDANLGALAELWWGQRSGSLAYIKMASGVGAGLILDGRIFRGLGGIAGEIGHTPVDGRGRVCSCGLRGCLHLFVGTPALLERVRRQRGRHPSSPLHAEPLTVDALVDAALEGDGLAVSVLRFAGRKLGLGVVNLLNLLNLERVVVGGAIARAGDLLLDPLRETIRAHALAASIEDAVVEESPLGVRGVAVGAATLVLENALADPSLFPSMARRGAPA